MTTSYLLEINEPIYNVKDGLKKLLNKRLKFLCKPITDEPLSTMILLITFLCRVITREELYYYFGYHDEIRTAIDRLTRKGKLESVSFSPKRKNRSYENIADSRSTKGLRVTRTGYCEICTLVGRSEDYFDDDTKTSMSILNSYALGMNFLSFLTNKFMPEIKYSQYARFLHDNPSSEGLMIFAVDKIYYIQEIEPIDSADSILGLVDLLQMYHRTDLPNYRDTCKRIVLSIRKPHIQLSPLGHQHFRDTYRYDLNLLNKAIKQIEWSHLCSGNPFIEDIDFDNITESLASTLEELIVNDKDTYNYLRPLYDDLINSGLDNLTESYEELEFHTLTHAHFISPIYHNEFNCIQLKAAIVTRNLLLERILEDYKSYDGMSNWGYLHLNQMSITCFPTNLIGHALPYTDYAHSAIRATVEATIRNKVQNFNPYNYIALDSIGYYYATLSSTDKIRIDLDLTNHYVLDSCDIYVEALTYDIGSVIRVNNAIRHFNSQTTHKIIIICLVLDLEDATYFSKLLPTRDDDVIHIRFLLTSDTFIPPNESYIADSTNKSCAHDNWTLAEHLGSLYKTN